MDPPVSDLKPDVGDDDLDLAGLHLHGPHPVQGAGLVNLVRDNGSNVQFREVGD